MRTILRLMAGMMAATAALPAAAQRERLICSETSEVSPGKALAVEFSGELNSDELRAGSSRRFSVSYRPIFFQATAPLVARSANLTASWPDPRFGAAQGGAAAPSLTMSFEAPVGTTVPAEIIACFWRGDTVIAETSGAARVEAPIYPGRPGSISFKRIAPAAIAQISGPIEIEMLSAADRRRIAIARFELSGFAETGWHRDSPLGFVIDPGTRKVASLAAICRRAPGY